MVTPDEVAIALKSLDFLSQMDEKRPVSRQWLSADWM